MSKARSCMREAIFLPPRYKGWRRSFDDLVAEKLTPGCAVLDVGAGCNPTLPPHRRARVKHYAALDRSAIELAKAPKGSYDETWQSDIVSRCAGLENRFDLVVSWQVLEHVKPLRSAIDNIRSYLRPGGCFIASLSGAFSVYALINRLVPARFGVWAMYRFLARDPQTVFPAYYDRCWHSALHELMKQWSIWEIRPFYNGAMYFNFSPVLRKLYLRYEEWALTTGRVNLATHYLIYSIK